MLNDALESFRSLSGLDQSAAGTVSAGEADVGRASCLTARQTGGHAQARQVNDQTQARKNYEVRAQLMRALGGHFGVGVSERPLTMRCIREVIREVEQPEVSVQAQNLKAGLVAGDTKVADARSIDALLGELKGIPSAKKQLKRDPVVRQRLQALQGALRTCGEARAHLAEVMEKKRGGDVDGARNCLTKAAEAEADLAAEIASFSNALRKSLKCSSRDLPTVDECLSILDDLSLSTELNAARIERLGEELLERKGDETADRLAQEFQKLVEGASPQKSDVSEAESAIGNYVKAAEPLLRRIVELESMPPNADTAKIAEELEQALGQAERTLEDIEKLSGVDPEAVRQLRENLAAGRKTLAVCRENVREKMLAGQTRELEQMLDDCQKLLENAIERYKDHRNNLDPENSKLMALFDERINRFSSFSKKITDVWKQKLDSKNLEDFFQQVENDIETCDENVLVSGGLAKFAEKCKALRSRGTNDTAKSSRINAELLARAFRGEVDLMNCLSLKAAGYTDEMIWADLVEKPGSKKEDVGKGSFNEVKQVEMTNVRTGKTEKVVLKDVELTGASLKYSVGGTFSSKGQVSKTDKINVATWKAASLINCGQQVTRSGMVRVGNRFLLAQELAGGATLANALGGKKAPVFEMPDPNDSKKTISASFEKGYESLSYVGRERLQVELRLAAAKLEWADLLTGQIDRSMANMMIKINVTGPENDERVEVVLKGIDNDIGFTEGQTGLRKFEVRGDGGETKKTKKSYNAEESKDLEALFKKGVHGLRIPKFLPLSVKKRLDVLDEDTFRREMKGLIEGDALEAAVARLKELKNLARTMEAEGYLVDDIKRSNTPDTHTLSNLVRHDSPWFNLDPTSEAVGAVTNIYNYFFLS